MATDTGSEAAFGRVSRLQGLVFEQLTRIAAFVGVVALFLLFYYTVRDAVRPATADPGWYAVLAVAFLQRRISPSRHWGKLGSEEI